MCVICSVLNLRIIALLCPHGVAIGVCCYEEARIFFLVWPLLRIHYRCRGLFAELGKTHWHTHTHTHGRTPLDEGSARRRGLCTCPAHNIQKRAGCIRTRNPSKRAAADLRLRLRGHRHRLTWLFRSRSVHYKDGNKRNDLLKVASFDKYMYPVQPPPERQLCSAEGFFFSIGTVDMWKVVHCVVT